MRLRGFDYSQDGAYFITICTRDRACLLGEVVDGEMHLSAAGRVAQAVWEGTPRHYPHVRLDAWTIMPNHVHGVVLLGETGAGATSVSTDGERGANDHSAPVGAGLKPAPTNARVPPTNASVVRHGLPEIVRAFKTYSARHINATRGTVGTPFWQRNYYEHVIRDEADLARIRQYIMDNPQRWHEDPENPMSRESEP